MAVSILAGMEPSAFERHLTDPVGRGPAPAGAAVGSSGGAPCGDLIRIALLAGDGRIEQASFDAEGCGAMLAAGSACVSLVLGAPLLEAARVGSADVAAELGGLSPGKHHAADLAADALHRALAGLWARPSQPLLEPSSPSACWWASAAASTARWPRCSSAGRAARSSR